jgi:putative heme-binding domain-containing protein
MSNRYRHLAIPWALAFSPQLVLAQADAPPSAKLIEEGQKAYARACAGCHGAEAEGSDRAPQLAGSRRLRARSPEQVRRLIYDGIPSSGMPAFHLPDEELDALTAFVHSLNSAASKTWVPGSSAAGEQFFFGKGDCASCHMVNGRGKPIGPDLSNVANEMTVGELKEALLRPDAHITPGYDLITVRLRDGQSIRGFARGRTNFDIQLQDLDGNFHLLQQSQIAAIQDEKRSLMKPLHLQPEELQDLIAFLSTLRGVPARPSSTDQPPESSGVTFRRIENPRPGDWLTYNGKLSGNRYSELKQINAANVHDLTVSGSFRLITTVSKQRLW